MKPSGRASQYTRGRRREEERETDGANEEMKVERDSASNFPIIARGSARTGSYDAVNCQVTGIARQHFFKFLQDSERNLKCMYCTQHTIKTFYSV